MKPLFPEGTNKRKTMKMTGCGWSAYVIDTVTDVTFQAHGFKDWLLVDSLSLSKILTLHNLPFSIAVVKSEGNINNTLR